jgi:hypothetical protein
MNIVIKFCVAGLFLWLTILLILKFRQTKDQGFIWLSVVLIILPALYHISEHLEVWAINKLERGESVWLFPYSLMRPLSRAASWDDNRIRPEVFHSWMATTKGILSLLLAVVAVSKLHSQGNAIGASKENGSIKEF